MRFLLKTNNKNVRSNTLFLNGSDSFRNTKFCSSNDNDIKSGNTHSVAARSSLPSSSSSSLHFPPTSSSTKTWGQQCSPNCGCTIRFETEVDSTTSKIVRAQYHALRVVTWCPPTKRSSKTLNHARSSQGLQPYLTHVAGKQQGRPLLTSCNCYTLHKLASDIVSTLPSFTLEQAQNQLEFQGVRSSDAFRRIVLHDILTSRQQGKEKSLHKMHQQDVPMTKVRNMTIHSSQDWMNMYGSCYDLVEEALTACLKGYLPKPRRLHPIPHQRHLGHVALHISTNVDSVHYESRYDSNSFHHTFDEPIRTNQNDDDRSSYSEEYHVDPLRYVRAAKQRMSHRSPSSSTFITTTSVSSPSSSISSWNSSVCDTQTTWNSSIMPAFHLSPSDSIETRSNTTQFSLMNHLDDLHEEDSSYDSSYRTQAKPSPLDWISYVDRLNSESDDDDSKLHTY